LDAEMFILFENTKVWRQGLQPEHININQAHPEKGVGKGGEQFDVR